VLIIDVSKSMLAEDYNQSSRLDKAREIVRHLLSNLQGNRVGIVTFAGTGFRQADLSEDFRALDFIVEHWVDTDAAGVGGSNLVRALEAGLAQFSNHYRREKLILLFSDGGDVESNLQAVLARAKHRQIRILTFGLGSMQPSRIPLYDTQHRFTGYVELDGKIVTTRLNEAPLKRIATATNGTYQRMSRRKVWPTLLTQGSIVSDLLTRNEQKAFQPFLLVGLLVCGAHTLITRL
jgi:Ca-activated chloride channel family protein